MNTATDLAAEGTDEAATGVEPTGPGMAGEATQSRWRATRVCGAIPEVGQRFAARVVGFVDTSALVRLRRNVTALLPCSQYSWVEERVDLKGRLKRGATIDVVVGTIEQKDDGRAYIKVSHRQTRSNPWETIDAEHAVGSKTWAQVREITPTATWVVLETGYGARIDRRELAWWPVPESAGEVMHVGQWIEVMLLTIDKGNRRIEASHRQAQEYPWETIERRHPAGSRTRAQVQAFCRAGTRIVLESGDHGWIARDELAWTSGQVHGSEVLQIGQWIDVMVRGVDREHRCVDTSYRETLDNPWKAVASRFPIGSETCGVVETVQAFGAFIRLDSAFSGLMHRSQMPAGKAMPSPGETVRVRILQFDETKMRIALGEANDAIQTDERAAGDIVTGDIVRQTGTKRAA